MTHPSSNGDGARTPRPADLNAPDFSSYGEAWRVCIDFGTAASKASLCRVGFGGAPSSATVRPLALSDDGGLAPSALLFHDGRVRFGAAALEASEDAAVTSEPLLSFKTFLSARDYDVALAMNLPRSIDESAAFRQRDALVLYSAYLLALTDRALAGVANAPNAASGCPRRYTHPLWKAPVVDAAFMQRVLNEADAVRGALGEAMFGLDGVSMADASAALTDAVKRPGAARIEAGVFEAQAAAACHVYSGRDAPEHVMVFDMGAGTTDIAAFAPGAVEIDAARRTSHLACDELDKIIVAMFMDRADQKAPRALRKKLWRNLRRRARRLKQDIFAGQTAEAQFEGKVLRVSLKDVQSDGLFKAFHKDLNAVFQASLDALAKRAAADGRDRIGIVLAGGGSALPFVHDMALRAKPRERKVRRVDVAPVVPDWARDASFQGALAPVFPQMAIAIGGAAAPLTI
ncbi:MAG: Hsp70 family protein [Hyphomonadaceae bacterium]|nr:Hsp70 family protein [Hyphomonadaceae bacterium]